VGWDCIKIISPTAAAVAVAHARAFMQAVIFAGN